MAAPAQPERLAILQHLLLPPRTPTHEDPKPERIALALLDLAVKAATDIENLKGSPCTSQWANVRRSLTICKSLHGLGALTKESLLRTFRALDDEAIIIVHVAMQNTALTIRRDTSNHGDDVIFEAFECSSRSADALAGSILQWDFPGHAVRIPTTIFESPEFQKEVATFLERASSESIKRFIPRSNQGRPGMFENRDTVDPVLIVQILMPLLEAKGTRIYPPVLSKHVRDDVSWDDGSAKPWRRSPFWLTLKVSLQRHLCQILGQDIGRVHYKLFLAVILAQHLSLLVDSGLHEELELLVLLKTKLCRRMAKLENDRIMAVPEIRESFTLALELFAPLLNQVGNATVVIDRLWDTFKVSSTRLIERLPRLVRRHGLGGPDPLALSLPNSGQYLERLLMYCPMPVNLKQEVTTDVILPDFDPSSAIKKSSRIFARTCFELTAREDSLETNISASDLSLNEQSEWCGVYANRIELYLEQVGSFYKLNPEQKSISILTIMESWMRMDRIAIKLFPLLSEFIPNFALSIMDVLQLTNMKDMVRLDAIRRYLERRHSQCKSNETIFGRLSQGCFGELYYNASSPSSPLRSLHQNIKKVADENKRKKEKEWNKKNRDFKTLKASYDSMLHLKSVDENGIVVSHDIPNCQKCKLDKQMDGFFMLAYEDPLPADMAQQKAVIFELACPPLFAKYRRSTWKILSQLALKPSVLGLMAGAPPTEFLHTYSELQSIISNMPEAVDVEPVVCLASIKKSILSAHWGKFRGQGTRGFPITNPNDVFMPCNLTYFFYDSALNVWISLSDIVFDFAHHVPLIVPKDSALSKFKGDFTSRVTGPTSFEIIASQTKCPSGLNIHEFIGYQTLLSGHRIRWLHILAELGSFNLNFSNAATALLMSHLTYQVGPVARDDCLGIVHCAFRDEQLSLRLLYHVQWRLDAISTNWRENNSLELIITLVLKVISFEDIVKAQATALLHQIRTVTLSWLGALRLEFKSVQGKEASDRCARYSLWAALLCRRTYYMHLDQHELLNAHALSSFIEASIALQDNMPKDPNSEDALLKNAMVRDMKLAYRLRHLIRDSILGAGHCLQKPFHAIWPAYSDGSSPVPQAPDIDFCEDSGISSNIDNMLWLKAVIDHGVGQARQIVHLHVLEGHLLVMGQPIGRLPALIREAAAIKHLFGDQILHCCRSFLPGMLYQAAATESEHEIHIGLRDGTPFVRAIFRKDLLELIDPSIFVSARISDLPLPLTDNCVHWLNLRAWEIDIRERKHGIWKSGHRNWRIDMRTRQARSSKDILINPQSRLCDAVALIFANFEDRRQLIVRQPRDGPLSVDLRRLDLTFTVNQEGWLESSRLQAEINNNQDIGTWYGHVSKLVVTDINPGQDKSFRRVRVLTPLGDLTCERSGPHVILRVANIGAYGVFTVNPILRRIECEVEPRLLYLKAAFHAFTSFAIPDTLTVRTGTEEAFHCLKSGYCQPWTPLSEVQAAPLRWIAKLTPHRTYYPSNLKAMQKPSWDHKCTTSMQHDGFHAVVQSIFEKSNDLAKFTTQIPLLPLDDVGDRHLVVRSQIRRSKYERLDARLLSPKVQSIIEYDSRHHAGHVREGSDRVLDIARLVSSWPTRYQTGQFEKYLQSLPSLGGFDKSYEDILLSDLLDLDLASNWGSLVALCCSFKRRDSYRLMFLLAMLAFDHRGYQDRELLTILAAFSTIADLKNVPRPTWPSFTDYQYEEQPTTNSLTLLIRPHMDPYPGDERDEIKDAAFTLSGKTMRHLQSLEHQWNLKQDYDARSLAAHLLQSWPHSVTKADGFKQVIRGKISSALDTIHPEWTRLYQNWDLTNYIKKVKVNLAQHLPVALERSYNRQGSIGGSSSSIPPLHQVLITRHRGNETPTLADLLRRSCSRPRKHNDINIGTVDLHNPGGSLKDINDALVTKSECSEIKELAFMVTSLKESGSKVKHQYGEDLEISLTAFKRLTAPPCGGHSSLDKTRLYTSIVDAQADIARRYGLLEVTPEHTCSSTVAYWLRNGGLWPCTAPIPLLETLRSISKVRFGQNTKESLVDYGLAITALQRSLRLDTSYHRSNRQRLDEELANVGHTNWSALEHTDWLLLEIDSNFLIRPIQVEVAQATISPCSRANSVLQMNMGQGKTSVIMPMAAAFLAAGESLVRIIVPKPLLVQTAQLMHARLGGLVGRDIIHIPFSRRTSTSLESLTTFNRLYQNVSNKSGIALALPEHVLSFQLSGQQQVLDNHTEVAREMVRMQQWITSHSRDIIDEADSILAIRTQLIYPSGSQKTLDGHPHRWMIAEKVLRQVVTHLENLAFEYKGSIEVLNRPGGGFPVIFFLRKAVEDALLVRLAEDVVKGRLPVLPTNLSASHRRLVHQFVSEPRIPREFAQSIGDAFSEKPAIMQTIHLLRGLFVHRILLMALKKRWNVQYGLHPLRDPIAVPFTAKGQPSEQAEWGHPDVAILFTCLSFYYDGLSLPQMKQTLEHVLKSDDPAQVYDRFSQNSSLPSSLKDWTAINVDDEVQLKEICRHLRTTVSVVDYFLNNHVFPRHAKQFLVKLQASGWDIPLFQVDNTEETTAKIEAATSARCMTTGFSGTNDWKNMLPLTIRQNDLPGLLHTNAEVLTYLLQDRNRSFVLSVDWQGKHLTEMQLLHQISSAKGHDGRRLNIRVLVDAGAQILEMTNIMLVQKWLTIDTTAQAAVYFGDDNKAWVYNRQGSIVPLLASSFADDLSECLVYLDESHTRGTDLKLPPMAVGALTLGLLQTKDHTVQAAMRLRQLGTTQSVVFFAPPEVSQSIKDTTSMSPTDENITSFHVVRWLLEQTCNGIEQLQPLYYAQGVDFCQRSQAVINNPQYLDETTQREAYVSIMRQVEQQTLEQLYGAKKKSKAPKILPTTAPRLLPFKTELEDRRNTFEDSGEAVHGSALQEVEQEREVQYEVELVREVQKPVHHEPLTFAGCHRDVLSFVQSGKVTADSDGYRLAFEFMGQTSLGKRFKIRSVVTSCRLFVTVEFTKTVQWTDKPLDHLQRPVSLLLWSAASDVAIIIIPEEAEKIIPLLRNNQGGPVHLLTYAAPVTRRMLHFNDLRHYALPSLPVNWEAPVWLKVELGIFAGRLYFEYSEYHDLLKFLGVEHSTMVALQHELRQLDGLDFDDTDESDTELDDKVRMFSRRPLAFLQEWLALRRKGQNFEHTPMGYVCQGKPLLPSHHFFDAAEAQAHHEIRPETRVVVDGNQVAESLLNEEEEQQRDEAGVSKWEVENEDYVFDSARLQKFLQDDEQLQKIGRKDRAKVQVPADDLSDMDARNR